MPSDLNLIKNPACTHGPGRTHADKNRRQMAARPLGLSPERGCETRVERSGGRGKPDKGRGGQGRQRSMEIGREKEEGWEQALSWCNFLGACIWRSRVHLCSMPTCLAWRVESEDKGERGERKGQVEKHQVIPKGRPVVNGLLHSSVPYSSSFPPQLVRSVMRWEGSHTEQNREILHQLCAIKRTVATLQWSSLGSTNWEGWSYSTLRSQSLSTRHTLTRLEVTGKCKTTQNPA